MGALFRLVRTAQITEARSLAPFQVYRKLLHAIAKPPASLDEQPVVLVEKRLLQQVDIVFRHVLACALFHVRKGQPRHVPALENSFRGKQRCACIHDRGAAIRASKGQGHGLLGGQEPSAVLVERLRHLHFAARKFLITEFRTFFEDCDAHAVAAERRQFLGHRPSAGAGADDNDVIAAALHFYCTASQPRGSGR